MTVETREYITVDGKVHLYEYETFKRSERESKRPKCPNCTNKLNQITYQDKGIKKLGYICLECGRVYITDAEHQFMKVTIK